MDSPQLHAVGFDFPSMDDLVKATFDAGVRGIDTHEGFDLIGTYTDPSGARIVFVKRTDEPAGTAAALSAAQTRHRAQVLRFTDQLAKVALYSREGRGPLLVEFITMLDDPVAYPVGDLVEGSGFAVVEDLQVALLALDVEVFANPTAFEISPAADLSPTMRFGAEDVVSPSLLGLKAAAIPPAEATPTLLASVTIDEVETRRNELSGVEFQYATGRTGGVLVTVAIPLERPVSPGKVVHGTFYGTCSSGTWD